jgi:putative nucleotidyltransferase with HDIG domain
MQRAETTSDSMRAIPPAVLGALLRVPPLSPAASKLYSLNEDTADLRRVANVIGVDPTLAAMLLRLVNSPLFGVRYPVSGVLQAVAMLGLERVRALATTAAMQLFMNKSAASLALRRCWRHSVACGLATREMAAQTGFDGDAAYTGGLLHDIGRFAMLSCWPTKYPQLLSSAEPRELIDRERELLGVSHTEAGGFLLQHWGLPLELATVAREHHRPSLEGHPRLVELVACGCHLADAVGFAVTVRLPDEKDSAETLSGLVADQEAFCFRVADGINQLECL